MNIKTEGCDVRSASGGNQLSVNSLLYPPPPPPLAGGLRGYQIPRSARSSVTGMQRGRDTSPFPPEGPYGNSNWAGQHAPHLSELRTEPSRPTGRMPIYPPPTPFFERGTRDPATRGPFQSAPTKPTGLRGPWDAAPSPRCGNDFQPPGKRKAPSDDGAEKTSSCGPPKKPMNAAGAVISSNRHLGTAAASSAEGGEGKEEEEERVVFPKELTMMFGALKCELCSVEVNSTVQSKMHYDGRVHEKKLAKYMQEWCLRTGQPLAKRFKEGAPKKKSNDGEDLYCAPCNVKLTSQQHANQHYMGRNHRRALAGRTPLKGGYFDTALNEWVRNPSPLPFDRTGRFNIGREFVAPLDPPSIFDNEDDPPPALADVKVGAALKATFPCELCKVNTTSQEQLDTHYSGAKHKKAVKAAGNMWSVDKQKIPAPAAQGDSILASLGHIEDFASQDLPSKKDYSIYRTPSGHYYCQPCNYSLNSEAQFGQHCDSKKHKQKAAFVKKPLPAVKFSSVKS